MRNLTPQETAEIIKLIVTDEEFQAGGIPKHEEYILQTYKITQKQFNSLCGKLWKIIKR